jgi:hypothetical protein
LILTFNMINLSYISLSETNFKFLYIELFSKSYLYCNDFIINNNNNNNNSKQIILLAKRNDDYLIFVMTTVLLLLYKKF